MDDELLEALLNDDENSSLDFKRDQYPFAHATDEEKSELLKDILIFANASRRTTAYILVGVDEVQGGRSIVTGVTHHLGEATVQQFVNGKVNRPIEFSYQAYSFEGKQIGIIAIPVQQRPFYLTKDYGRLTKRSVY
jgi:predicted HTH transcriptional regulator